MMPSLLSLLRSGRYSIRDMSKKLGISKYKVSRFIAELERRKWIEVTRCEVYFYDGAHSNKQNEYKINI